MNQSCSMADETRPKSIDLASDSLFQGPTTRSRCGPIFTAVQSDEMVLSVNIWKPYMVLKTGVDDRNELPLL